MNLADATEAANKFLKIQILKTLDFRRQQDSLALNI